MTPKQECEMLLNMLLQLVEVMLKKNASVTSVPVENIEENIQANISSDENNIELLKKYKQLLDDNAITQEEFDAKKKQLLGL